MHRIRDIAVPWESLARLYTDYDVPLRMTAMPLNQPHARPILQNITIRLHSDTYQYDAETRQEIAMRAVAQALLDLDDGTSPAWRIYPLEGRAPLMYELLPLPGCRVGSKQAWEMVAALRTQPDIAAAEPSFVPAGEER
jgi:hypothetical protein